MQNLILRLIRNREALIVILFSSFGALGSLLSNRFLTEVSTPAELGKLYLYLNLTLWITVPTTSSYLFVVHYWPVAVSQQKSHWFAKKILLGLVLQAIFSVIVLMLCLNQHWLGISDLKSTILLILISIGQAFFQVFYPIPAAERRRILSGFLDWMNTLGRPLTLALGIWIIGSSNFENLLNAQTFHSVFAGIIAIGACYWILGSRKDVHTLSADRNSSLLSMSSYQSFFYPALVSTVISQLSITAERWGLASRVDSSATAIFVQATGLSVAAAGGVNSILMGYFYPIINQYAAESDHAPLRNAWKPVVRFLKLSILMFTTMAVVGSFGSEILTSLFFGERFVSVGEILPITLVAAAIMGFTQTLTIPIYVARDAYSPNLSRSISLGIYALILFLFPSHRSNPTSYAWIYLCSQMGYLALVGFSFLKHKKKITA